MRPRMAYSFSKSRKPKERDVLMSATRQQSTSVSLRWGGGGGIKTYGKRVVVAMLVENKQFHNLGVFGPQDAAIMSLQ